MKNTGSLNESKKREHVSWFKIGERVIADSVMYSYVYGAIFILHFLKSNINYV